MSAANTVRRAAATGRPSLTVVPVPPGRASASAPAVRARRALGIRWVAASVAVVLTVAAALGVGVVSERNARTALAGEIRTRLQLQARNLANAGSSALLEEYPELTLHPLAKELAGQQPELALVAVVDHEGRIAGAPDARLLGTAFAPPAGFRRQDGLDPLSNREQLQAAGPLLVARAPVLRPGGQVLGAVYVGLPLQHVGDVLAASRRQQALLLALLVGLGAVVAFVLMSQLLRPMSALRAGIDRIGRGDFGTPIALRDRTELGLLADAVDEMAVALQRAQAEMLERERLSHEVTLARNMQRSLLPAGPLAAGPFDIRGDQRAAAEVGGDYWDALALPDGRVGIAIADVAGKGLAGCLVMSMLSALLRALRATHATPSAMLAALDERLSESLRPGVFVTMWYGVLDPKSGELAFSSAGHNPLVVWRAATGTLERIESGGIPLAAFRNGAIRATLRDRTLHLGPGDVLVQYTDGYTEAFHHESGEQLGAERFERTVAERAAQGGEAVLQALRAQVREWSGDGVPSDDETLVVVTRSGAPPALRLVAAAGAGEDGTRAALALLEAAEAHGRSLKLTAKLEQLPRLDAWARALPELAALPSARFEAVRLALYEACANVVEHGCGDDGRDGPDVWWLPGAPAGGGRFVIRDGGRPFHPDGRRPVDFQDPVARTRGRGIGLEIIHRAVQQVSYHPATPRGNVTVLAFGPDSPTTPEEETAS